MSESTILKEYLIAIGFKVDEKGSKKVDTTLVDWDKRATRLTRGLGAVAVAAAGMVQSFASNMEKLYYSSKRVDSTVGSIQALEYGASRAGIGTGVIRQSLEAMARNMRANPGLQGLLNSLGVKVTGRDKADVLTDLVAQLRKMPFYVGQQYANLFGIDPDTLFQLEQGLEAIKAAGEERKRLAAELKVDSEEAARASVEYNNQWREVLMRAGLFRDVLAMAILPKMLEIAGVTKEVLADWTNLIRQQPQQGSLLDRFAEGIGLTSTDRVSLSKESRERLGISESDTPTVNSTNLATGEKTQYRKNWLSRGYDRFMEWAGAGTHKTPLADQASVDAAQDDSPFKRGGKGAPAAPAPDSTSGGGTNERAAALFARLEQQYALPAGMLDRMWKTESARGTNMGPSSAGAKGHFQFMDGTAAQYGVADPNDLTQSATGAAKYLADLNRQFGGDWRTAAGAYNWGPGNMKKYGLGRAPAETRNYMDAVAGPAGITIKQENNISVTGVNDPAKAAVMTREAVDQANADVIRNMKAKVM